MIGAEHAFQHAFHQALLAPADDVSRWLPAVGTQAAFAVYRNTVMKGCVDALQANFPTVDRLVGAEWFRDAAARFVSTAPPHDSRLLVYGDGFPAWLTDMLPPDLLYVAEVARLDIAWRDSHTAADAPVLDPAALARLAPDALADTTLQLHPAARWIWFDTVPAFAIWCQHRPPAEPPRADLDWHGDGGLLTRPGDTVQWQALDAATHGFLKACADGHTLGHAAEDTLQRHPGVDLSDLLQQLLACGAFTTIAQESP